MKAAILAVRSHLPDRVLTNEELAREFTDWDADKILAKTGIRQRHIAAEGECASDLGVRAAEKLFAAGIVAREDIDYLLLCTQSPDYFLPTTACVMQARLGLRDECGALDFNLGCSGFVYGLSLAKGLVESGQAKRVLLITAETYSKYLDPKDRGVRTIFGDGAAACLVAAVPGDQDLIGPLELHTDGRGADKLIVEAGGHRRPLPAGAPCRLFMSGPDIFTFTIDAVPRVVASVLEKGGRSFSDVKLFIFHQANRFMLEHLRKKIDIPADRFCIDMEDTANTVSSTIPIAYERALASGRLTSGDLVMLVGFGVGLSWGAALVRVV